VARDSVDGADILEISGEKREASGGGRLCCVGADFVPLGDSRLAKTVLDVLGKTRRMFGKERHTASPGWGIDDFSPVTLSCTIFMIKIRGSQRFHAAWARTGL
jgi:hypothetical protein